MSKKSKELKGASVQELQSKLTEMKKEMIKINAQIASGTQLKNPGQAKMVKKSIARILTEITAKGTSAPEAKTNPKEVKKNK